MGISSRSGRSIPGSNRSVPGYFRGVHPARSAVMDHTASSPGLPVLTEEDLRMETFGYMIALGIGFAFGWFASKVWYAKR